MYSGDCTPVADTNTNSTLEEGAPKASRGGATPGNGSCTAVAEAMHNSDCALVRDTNNSGIQTAACAPEDLCHTVRDPNDVVYVYSAQDGDTGYLSHFYMAQFKCTDSAQQFNCMEQYLMYNKAITAGDSESAARVMGLTDPGKMKAIGRQISSLPVRRWDDEKESVALRGNLFKFMQNPEPGSGRQTSRHGGTCAG